MPEEMDQIGRLAMRVEGDWWVAYYALPDTMDDALRLGSIHMSIVENRDRKEEFLLLMRTAVGDLIESKTGVRPQWPTPPQRAPENERSGSA